MILTGGLISHETYATYRTSETFAHLVLTAVREIEPPWWSQETQAAASFLLVAGRLWFAACFVSTDIHFLLVDSLLVYITVIWLRWLMRGSNGR